MSLILDALRKSEAERRRGESPSLYSSLPTPGTRRRPTALRYLPWVVAAVLVVVALFAFRKDDAPATKDELTQDSARTDASEPVSGDTGFETAAVVAAAPTTTPPPPPPTASGPPTPTVDALVKPPPIQTPPAPVPAAAIPAPPAAAIAAAPADASDAEEQLPPLAVLDPGTRSSLPALKVSMHFYSSDPGRRFAIIDGQRITEGMQVGAGVVTQIRRDGVVLDINGRRVLLPRP